MPVNAGDATEDSADEVSEEVREAAHESFGGAAEIPKTPHIETNVNNTEVDEHAGYEAPPLAVEGERAKISAELDGLRGSGVESGDATENHGGEDQGVGGDERDGDGEGSCG